MNLNLQEVSLPRQMGSYFAAHTSVFFGLNHYRKLVCSCSLCSYQSISLKRKRLFLVMNMAFAVLLLGTFSVPFYINFVGDAQCQFWTGKYSFYLVAFRCINAIFMFGSYLYGASISCAKFYAVYQPFKNDYCPPKHIIK